MLLRPKKRAAASARAAFFGWFNRAFDWTTNRYLSGVVSLIRRSALRAGGPGRVLWLVAGGFSRGCPPASCPDEDQGAFFVSVRLPDGASTERDRRRRAQDRGGRRQAFRA